MYSTMDGLNKRASTRVKYMKTNAKLSDETWDIIGERHGEGFPEVDVR